MSDHDLSLVPFEALRDEIYKRSEACLIVNSRSIDAGDPVIEVNFHGGCCTSIGLAQVAIDRLVKKASDGLSEVV